MPAANPTLIPRKYRGPNKGPTRTNAAAIPVRPAELGDAMVEGTPLDQLYDDLARFTFDPLGFVRWAFPWGEPGTALEDEGRSSGRSTSSRGSARSCAPGAIWAS